MGAQACQDFADNGESNGRADPRQGIRQAWGRLECPRWRPHWLVLFTLTGRRRAAPLIEPRLNEGGSSPPFTLAGWRQGSCASISLHLHLRRRKLAHLLLCRRFYDPVPVSVMGAFKTCGRLSIFA